MCALFISFKPLQAQEKKAQIPQEAIATTWNGSTWSDGIPNKTTKAIFAGDFTATTNFTAFSVKVQENVKVNFTENAIVTIVNGINVAPTGNFNLNEKAQLVQLNPNAVNSAITFTRFTNYLKQYDYTYFSSPVDGQPLYTIGADTVLNNTYIPFNGYSGPRFDKFFYWDAFATPDLTTVVSGKWTGVPKTNTMETCKGYIIRAPQSFPANYEQKWKVAFTGEPHNAISYTYPISGSTNALCSTDPNYKYKASPNLVGNPYPCSLDLDTFLTNSNNMANTTGAVYFWTHKVPIASAGNGTYQYQGDDYILYNAIGGLGYKLSGVPDPAFPNMNNRNTGKAASCQSFFVNGITPIGGIVEFRSNMRGSYAPDTSPIANDGQFYKASGTNPIPPTPPVPVNIIKSRIWLSLQLGTNSTGKYKETLIGYTKGQLGTENGDIPPATNGFENLYDTQTVSIDNTIELYSILDTANPCPKLAIQGRALGTPFNTNDVVNLGFSCPAGTYKIKAELWDGIFTNGQSFMLRELLPNNTFQLIDIKTTAYTFTTSTSTLNNTTRFQLVFVPPVLTQVQFLCGTTLSTLATQINADIVSAPGATISYVWQLTTGIAPNITTIIVPTTLKQLILSNVPGIIYNTTYTIQVAGIINGVQQPYSSINCTITTPVIPPPTTLQNCGAAISNTNPFIRANQILNSGLTGYAWRVTRTDTNQVGLANTLGQQLSLADILVANITPSGVPTFVQFNKQYCVEVAARYANNVISAYSPVCCYTTSLLPRSINTNIKDNLEIQFMVAYPNPFTNNFNLKLATINNEAVSVKVYDMLGKLVDNYNVLDSEIENLEIGNNYNSGIYNIVISSSDNVFTQRIIKR